MKNLMMIVFVPTAVRWIAYMKCNNQPTEQTEWLDEVFKKSWILERWGKEIPEWKDRRLQIKIIYYDGHLETYPYTTSLDVIKNKILAALQALQAQHERELDKARELRDLQGSDGSWDYDPYNHGLYNGMEMIVALLENREPSLREAPKKWSDDRFEQELAVARVEAKIEEYIFYRRLGLILARNEAAKTRFSKLQAEKEKLLKGESH